MDEEVVISGLFETNALQVSNENKPFWYTSGTIGPYFINTHFLYGNKKKSEELLRFIDDNRSKHVDFVFKLQGLIVKNYESDNIFKATINYMVQKIGDIINLENIDAISGGERRDWFFSIVVSRILGKKHLTIFKDGNLILSDKNKEYSINDLENKNILHIADLVTLASSYMDIWIPCINKIGAIIDNTACVIDRKQGGKNILKKNKINLISMIDIDQNFFVKALELKFISKEQFNLIKKYLSDPYRSMRDFMIENPLFLKNSLNEEGKNSERARKCIESRVYGDIRI